MLRCMCRVSNEGVLVINAYSRASTNDDRRYGMYVEPYRLDRCHHPSSTFNIVDRSTIDRQKRFDSKHLLFAENLGSERPNRKFGFGKRGRILKRREARRRKNGEEQPYV